jgi:polyisoprenoid-binding protein YceI
VDLASLETDQDRRDNYVRRNTLETDQYPTAVLVPTEIRGLTPPFPASGERTFQLVGDLTVHGVTRSSVWDVQAVFGDADVRGSARTAFTFADHAIEKPSLARLLSVADEIRLELDFRMRVEGTTGGGG